MAQSKQKTPLSFGGAKVCFDVTIPADKYKTWKDLHRKLSGYCKKFAFQLEAGRKTGFRHWQVRLSLISKKTIAALVTDIIPNIHDNIWDWSLTSDTVHNGPKHFNYVMKEETKIDGSWTDQTPCDEKPPMTRQLREFMEIVERGGMYEYQQYLYEQATKYDDRKITLIYDTNGNSGKSRLVDLLEYEEKALYVPPLETMKDISQYICCFESRECYCFDLPRAMKKQGNQLRGIYTGIELLKDGRMFDTRYFGKRRRLDCPQIFVFANGIPNWDLLSPDRWEILEIQPDKRGIIRSPAYYTCRITSES